MTKGHPTILYGKLIQQAAGELGKLALWMLCENLSLDKNRKSLPQPPIPKSSSQFRTVDLGCLSRT